jgi:hypothetical protein
MIKALSSPSMRDTRLLGAVCFRVTGSRSCSASEIVEVRFLGEIWSDFGNDCSVTTAAMYYLVDDDISHRPLPVLICLVD